MNLESLLDQLENESDFEIRRYVPDKLAKLGSWKSTKPLGEIVIDTTESTILRNEAVESLGKQGDPRAIEYLSQVLDDPNAELRRTAVWSLGQIGTPDIFELITPLVDDEDDQVKRWIAKSLARIDHPDIPKFLEAYWNRESKDNTAVKSDIIRAAINFINAENCKFWYQEALSILKESNPSRLVQPSALMIFECLKFNPNLNPEELVVLIDMDRNYLKNVRLILFKAIGVAKCIQKLMGYLEGEFPNAIVGIGYGNFHDVLNSFFVKFSDLSHNYQIALLEAILISDYNPNPSNLLTIFNTQELDMKLLILSIFAKQQIQYNLLEDFSKSEKGKYRVLELMGCYPQGLETLCNNAIHGDKVARKIAVEQLTNDVFLAKQEQIATIINALQTVSTKDPIWHIRRDARKGIAQIK